jgi:ATP-dependent DNA ligase
LDLKPSVEGIVSKRAYSRYRSGPSKAWRKIKCFTESELEAVGVLRKPGASNGPDGDTGGEAALFGSGRSGLV